MPKRFLPVSVGVTPERARYTLASGEERFDCDDLRDAAIKARALNVAADGRSPRIVLEHLFAGEWLPVAHFVLVDADLAPRATLWETLCKWLW